MMAADIVVLLGQNFVPKVISEGCQPWVFGIVPDPYLGKRDREREQLPHGAYTVAQRYPLQQSGGQVFNTGTWRLHPLAPSP
jgi:hypothetical protein